MYFIAFTVFTSAKTRKNPGRNKDSENIHLGRNRTRRTEYTPLRSYLLRDFMAQLEDLKMGKNM